MLEVKTETNIDMISNEASIKNYELRSNNSQNGKNYIPFQEQLDDISAFPFNCSHKFTNL